MSVKERFQAEIQALSRAELDELFMLILQFLEQKRQSKSGGILSRLAQIQFEGPEDLSVNHNLYITGEKVAKPDSD